MAPDFTKLVLRFFMSGIRCLVYGSLAYLGLWVLPYAVYCLYFWDFALFCSIISFAPDYLPQIAGIFFVSGALLKIIREFFARS